MTRFHSRLLASIAAIAVTFVTMQAITTVPPQHSAAPLAVVSAPIA